MKAPDAVEDSAETAPLTYRQVLASRNVPQLLLAACLSRLAGGMLLFVIVLYVITEFHSVSMAGLCGFFMTLPGFLVSPIAGAVLDRLGAVRAVALDTMSSAVFISGIALLALGGVSTEPVLFVLLALYSLTSPLTAGGIRTLFPRFVPEAAYDKANALDLSTFSAIDVVGPLLAGAMFAAIGPNPTLFAIAGMYVLAGLSLNLLCGGTAGAPSAPRRHLLRSAWEGITYLFRNPTLRGLAVSYALYQAAAGMLIVIVPVVVAERLDGGRPVDRYVGLMWAITGLAGAVGGLIAGKVLRVGVARRYMVAATLVCAVAIFPVSALGSLVTLGIGLMLVGLAEGAVNVSLLSLRQRRTEPDRLGRIMTVSISVNLIGFPIGTALGGALATHSVTVALATAALLAVGSAAAARLLIPREA
ncbi:MFS transporter [Streptomyces sp. NPDC002573]|uniref:MFS transporter n=1 Tax=Streptomyces sp. NPDC002573 TaxID=3364651 RepID=UPI0036BFD00E